ncbi:MAG: PKD domain-containing protein, partial [Bacteroidota bacterium]
MRRLYMNQDTTLSVSSNKVYENLGCCDGDIRGILINESKLGSITGNTIRKYIWGQPRGIEVVNSQSIVVADNSVSVRNYELCCGYWSMGVYLAGGSNRNVTVRGNTIFNYNTTIGYGIYMDNGDSVYVKGNTLSQVANPIRGYGISLYNIVNVLEVDSNSITGYLNEGIRSRPTTNSNWKVRYNTINSIQDAGIYAEGTGAAQYIGNRITGIKAGKGIVVNGPSALVANNYIQTEGQGVSKGISLQSSGTGSKIVFNSVNVTGNDILNGQALEVLGGNNYIVKNNIFADNGGGYAAYLNTLPSIRDWDYNCYWSTGNRFGYYAGQDYNLIVPWGQAINSDPNSKRVNPFYESDTALLPFQKQLNGAGVATSGILLDIDGELRNQQAPDVGAQEFMVDFGITRLISPTNECSHTSTEPVRIYLRQFGDVPFTDIRLAYQVNNGSVYYDTIPGSIENDLEFTFDQTQDLSVSGTYLFKIWLVDNADDNINNDTIRVIRVNRPAPVVDFSFTPQCANQEVPFIGVATVFPGFIDRYEWNFGDSTTGLGDTVSHVFDLAGTYSVTLQAYSDQGCYSEIIKTVSLFPTPDARFTVANVCQGSPVVINNQSIMSGGTGTISYLWDFGDGTTSASSSPTHLYANPGTYTILLTTSSANGCQDTLSRVVVVKPRPALSTNLASNYFITSSAVFLQGTPIGGTFIGAGITGSYFVPALAGLGTFVIKYGYLDPVTGCRDTLYTSVTVSAVAPQITLNPISQSACQGRAVTLSVQATGSPLRYQWYKNGVAIPGEIFSVLTLTNLSLSSAGSYSAMVYNPADTVYSTVATL